MSSIAEEAAGPSYTVPALCDALAKLSARTELHVLEAGPKSRYGDAAYELHVHRRLRLLKPIDGSPAMQRALASRAADFDLFHSHGLWRMPGLYAARSALRSGKPLLVTPRGMLEPAALRFSHKQKRVFWLLGQGSAIARAHCLHATSEAELLTLRRLGLRNPIAVVANGVEVPPQRRRPGAQDQCILLYLGRLHPIKGLGGLVDAWSRLESRYPKWTLRMVGPSADSYRKQLEDQCRQLGVQRVTFGDATFGPEKQREFEAAQLYVLPSHSENFGMTAAEALACGLPVLASRGTPWAGLQTHACGSWVDNSPASLEQALDRLLSLPVAELEAMGARGRAWMERDFAWASKAAQMLEVYAWLLDRKRKCPSFVETVNGGTRPGNRTLGAWWAPW
jgi:glycosyltransferase involved in cell wall biosynthesis